MAHMAEATALSVYNTETLLRRTVPHEKEEKKPTTPMSVLPPCFTLLLCPRLPAIPLRLLLQGPTQKTCFLPLVSTILSGGSLSKLLLHILTRALISHRSNNTAALFELCCAQSGHLRLLGQVYLSPFCTALFDVGLLHLCCALPSV